MIDPNMSPPGKHVASIFVQYVPYHLNGGWTEARREAFGDAVIDTLAEYAPNIKSTILHRQVLTPLEIEKTLGLSEAFTGLVIVAIAGNAVENVVGIQLAVRNKMDYAVSVILNSSLQVALALTPVAADHDGPCLRVHPGAERGAAEATVGSLIDFLSGPEPAARWTCPLDWGGRIELTVDRGPKEARP